MHETQMRWIALAIAGGCLAIALAIAVAGRYQTLPRDGLSAYVTDQWLGSEHPSVS
jgi:hypothetical protein